MEAIEKTMEVFGGFERTAYTPKEVKTLIELRDNLHRRESIKLQSIIGIMLVVCFFLVFAIIMLLK